MAISFRSVCVPRVTMHSDVSDVERVFNSVFGGEYVERVDMHETTDSKGLSFQVMFVHFKQDLPANRWTDQFYQKLERDKMVNVMTGYRKFYWKVYYNQSADKDKPKKVPHIMTPEEEAEIAMAKAYKEAVQAQNDAEVTQRALDQENNLVEEVAAELIDGAAAEPVEAAAAAVAAEAAADAEAAEEDVVLSTVD